jgi:hypothetical protein
MPTSCGAVRPDRPPPPLPPRRPHRLVALVGLLAVGLLLAPAGPAASEPAAWRSFEVSAAADGLRVTTIIPGGPLNDRLLDGSAPRAQALLEGLGSSMAFAAGVYPDELVLNVPGLGAGITGAPLPAYPLIAASSHPTKDEDEIAAPGVRLHAESRAEGSSALATSESEGTGHTSTRASVADTGDALVGEAESVTRGAELGPLTIGTITTTARVQRSPAGEVERESSLVISGARLGEQPIELPPDDGSPAAEALAEQGLTVRYLAAHETPTGVVAPGLQIGVSAPVSLVGDGSSEIIYEVGRASAAVDAVPAEIAADAAVSPPPSGPAPAQGAEPDFAAGVAPAPGPAPVAPSSGGDPAFDPQPPVDAGTEELAAADVPAAQAAPTAPGLTDVDPVAAALVPQPWSITFYLTLVGAAGLGLVSTAAFRHLGVRRIWAS